MASLFDSTRNFSLYTIPAAWVVALAPHVYAAQIFEARSSKAFDATAPRSFTTKVQQDPALDAATKGRIIRAEGAQQNGFENLGLFAAAVAAGNAAGLDHWWLNALSGAYVMSRIAYTLIYVNNESKGLAQVRSVVFLSGVGVVWTLFIMAGNKLRSTI
ncbi:hypothetical protein LTR66_004824 [Elasticomyces elasticus]|nr:hypothetical protein LTR50_004939 [Elasticomyces elasticus]KAK4995331.1 hypothetical protein LTR66_004824 [Elasticomyces elasticus]